MLLRFSYSSSSSVKNISMPARAGSAFEFTAPAISTKPEYLFHLRKRHHCTPIPPVRNNAKQFLLSTLPAAANARISAPLPLFLHRSSLRLSLTPTSVKHSIISWFRRLRRDSRSVVRGQFL